MSSLTVSPCAREKSDCPGRRAPSTPGGRRPQSHGPCLEPSGTDSAWGGSPPFTPHGATPDIAGPESSRAWPHRDVPTGPRTGGESPPPALRKAAPMGAAAVLGNPGGGSLQLQRGGVGRWVPGIFRAHHVPSFPSPVPSSPRAARCGLPAPVRPLPTGGGRSNPTPPRAGGQRRVLPDAEAPRALRLSQPSAAPPSPLAAMAPGTVFSFLGRWCPPNLIGSQDERAVANQGGSPLRTPRPPHARKRVPRPAPPPPVPRGRGGSLAEPAAVEEPPSKARPPARARLRGSGARGPAR